MSAEVLLIIAYAVLLLAFVLLRIGMHRQQIVLDHNREVLREAQTLLASLQRQCSEANRLSRDWHADAKQARKERDEARRALAQVHGRRFP